MPGISSIVVTLNEEDNIKDCLESIKWSDEIIVVDSGSTDKTVEIARTYTDKVFVENLIYTGRLKNFGIDKATCEWLLWIDADERVTEGLKNEIQKITQQTPGNPDSPSSTDASEGRRISPQAYLIKRKSFFINKFIKHCGWYPDYTLRLFRRATGIKLDDKKVHEIPVYNGETVKLKSELLHYTDMTFEHYLKKLNSYTTRSAREMFEKDRKASMADIIFRPAFTFFKMYFLKLGFLDGYMGLILCVLSGTYVFFKYSKLYYLNLKK